MRLGWGSGRKGGGGVSAFCRAIITVVQCLSFIICNDPACLSPLPPQSTLDYQGRFVLAYPTFLLTMQAGRQAGRHPPLSHSGTTPDSGGHSGTPTNGGTGSCNPAHMSIRPHSQVYMISKQLIYYWMHAFLYYYYYTCR